MPNGLILTDNHDGTATLSGTSSAGEFSFPLKASNTLVTTYSATQSFTAGALRCNALLEPREAYLEAVSEPAVQTAQRASTALRLEAHP
jgi:hypothetical protein